MTQINHFFKILNFGSPNDQANLILTIFYRNYCTGYKLYSRVNLDNRENSKILTPFLHEEGVSMQRFDFNKRSVAELLPLLYFQ